MERLRRLRWNGRTVPPERARRLTGIRRQLTHHLNEIDQEANEMLDLLIKQMVQAQGITEQLKADNQIAWVGAMNNIRIAAEEIVYQELIGL